MSKDNPNRRSFLKGKFYNDTSTIPSTPVQTNNGENDSLSDVERDPNIEALADKVASEQGVSKEHAYLVIAGVLGVGMATSAPANAGIINEIVDKIVKRFTSVIENTLGSLYDLIFSTIDEKSTKEGAAIATMGDAINEVQRSVANRQLALDAEPSPGECAGMGWAYQEKKSDATVASAKKTLKGSAEKTFTAPAGNQDYTAVAQKQHFEMCKNIVGVGAGARARVANATSASHLTPSDGATFSSGEKQNFENWMQMLFAPSDIEAASVLNQTPKNVVERENYVSAIQRKTVINISKDAFIQEAAQYEGTISNPSKAQVRKRFMQRTVLSESWYKEIQDLASPVPLTKALLEQQAFSNQLMSDMNAQLALSNRLAAAALAK